MTEHEQKCLNDALHKLQVRDWQFRLHRKIGDALDRTPVKDQIPLLRRLEGLL